MLPAHPTGRLLDEFVLGRLADDDHSQIEEHLGGCPECQSLAASRTNCDRFTELLAAAQARENPIRSEAETPLSTFAPTLDFEPKPRVAAAPIIPPGLLNHPRYRLLRPLGSGGMGTVWLAEHLVLGRQVAVKVIHPEFLARPEAAERFRREARSVAGLAHPNIVAAYDAEEVAGIHFLAMEYVRGENLVERVQAGGPLPVADACRAARDAARALAAAHAAGLIHRDVKPHNLIRTPEGTTKVLDFGLATAAAGSADLTGPDAIVGTPDYIAREQAEDPRAADARSDVYALDGTLYYLVAGHPPFPNGTILQKLDAHRDRDPAPIRGMPAGLAAILTKMMAKRPADRYQTAAAVAEALEPFCDPRPAVRARPASGRRRWLIAAAVLLGLIAMVAGGIVIIRDHEGKEIGRVGIPAGGKVEVVPGEGGMPAGVVVEGATEVRQFYGHTEAVYAVAISADSKFAATAGGDLFNDGGTTIKKGLDYTIRLWDMGTGKEVRRMAGHMDTVTCLAFSSDGRRLASGSNDKSVRLWDVASGKPERVLEGHKDKIQSVAFSPDGRRLVSAGWKSQLLVWDAASGKEARKLDATLKTTCDWQRAVYSPDGRHVVAGGWTALVVFDVATSTVERRFRIAPKYRVYAAAYSADGRRIVTAARWDPAPDSAVVQVWDAESGEELLSVPGIFAAFRSADGGRVLVADARRSRWVVWDAVRTCKVAEFPARISSNSNSNGFAVSAEGRLALLGELDGTVRLWRLPADH